MHKCIWVVLFSLHPMMCTVCVCVCVCVCKTVEFPSGCCSHGAVRMTLSMLLLVETWLSVLTKLSSNV